jgi:putative acyl-CoA dehydrogenase
MIKDRHTRDAFLAEVSTAKGIDRNFDAYVAQAARLMDTAIDNEFFARPATEAMARALQGAELLRHSTREVAEAFIATRLMAPATGWGVMLGTIGTGIGLAQARPIVQRARVIAA